MNADCENAGPRPGGRNVSGTAHDQAPVVAIALEGIDSIKICRAQMGATFRPDAAPGTIRGDFGSSHSYNLVHGNDSPEAAARELKLFFPDGLVTWECGAQN